MSRRVRWAASVVSMGRVRKLCKAVAENHEEKRQVGRRKDRWVDVLRG
jgi:hypothetical protein